MYDRTRSPWRKLSRGSNSSRRSIASARPRSTTTLPNSTRLTRPLTISPTRSLNSLYWRWRSASRTFWTITCFAVCAAIRPKSMGGSGSVMKSPISASVLSRREKVFGQDELCPDDRGERQANLASLANQADMLFGTPEQPPAETLAAVERRSQVDPGLETGEAVVIFRADQRAIDPRRADFEQ